MRRVIGLVLLVLASGAASAQIVSIDDFDSYSGTTELLQVWAIDAGSSPSASLELQTPIANSAPNSMAFSSGILAGIGDGSSAGIDFSPPLEFLQGTLTSAFQVSSVLTNVPANQLDVEVVLASGVNSCLANTTRPTNLDVWELIDVAIGSSCDMVDLAAVTELTVRIVNRGPNDDVSATVFWDDLAIADAVPVELMRFEIE
jgi:hypothetical protein